MECINRNEFEVCGIPYWHALGYSGRGVRIANMESCFTEAWYFNKPVIDPFSQGRAENNNSHGNQTMNIINQVAPEADLYILPRGGSYTKDEIKGGLVEQALPFIVEERIHLVNASLGGRNHPLLNEMILAAQKSGASFICSAGNSGDRGASPYARSGVWISVGAVVLTESGKVNLTSYSSIDPAVDFVQFGELYAHDLHDKNGRIPCSGTSFASPLLTGMLALVQQFFIEKTGSYLNSEGLYRFMLEHSIDLGQQGRDPEYGNGLFMLPFPETIDVDKYVTTSDNTVASFRDLSGHWGESFMLRLVKEGVLNGYPDGTLRPDGKVTRAELSKVICVLMDIMKK